MKNILKIMTGIWFIMLMFQVLSAYAVTLAGVPDMVTILMMMAFAVVVVREFKRGIVREMEQDSSGS
ncbi:hypothetical protein [Salibacterium halotolerans]|uniref:Uncharacterized protein n=1 Tax=Salibacterium halotolerans TaxID=1884432 RepID=A0A1I5RLR1_9BACI|nr:hypothetical protein [Salibacterium halotolerans]SFP59479.1 hypothetical protein SAMN05518683_10793 [Salibacterium halotolerans]